MSINTRSSFFFGFTVNDLNNRFSFNEGASELNAVVSVGEYTLESFLIACANAMTTVGSQTYGVVVDRVTRIVTISASTNFSLLTSSGSNIGTFALLGFSGSDRTGVNSYEGNLVSGQEYRPQFNLQGYVSPSHYKEAVSESINESGSGDIQVISYGTRQFMECNITFATDIDQGDSNPIETNLNGVADLETFMDNITGKTKIEFMEDRDSPTLYMSFILESSPGNKNGTGYKLKELYSKKLPNYFETGVLKFRKITE